MNKLFLCLALACGTLYSASAQPQMPRLDQMALPADTSFRIGTLPNGITYYLRHNEEPKNRANFYIIRKVGALHETDQQNGLAHFLEHMSFNGTKNFPGNTMIESLQRNGISFGGDLNAYTSFDQTVYNINNVPTTNAPLMDTCLLILHDWSYYVTLDQKELDEERGVITEEWRTRRNASSRIRNQFMPVLCKGSQYAVRDVIGSLDVIQNFKRDDIMDLYRNWYRSDLEAIAIAGDFNVDEMEVKVKKMFSEIPAVQNPRKNEFFAIPEHEDTYYCLATDPEVPSSSIMVVRFWRNPSESEDGVQTLQEVKDAYCEQFFNSIINQRISESIQKGTAPYLGASVGIGDFMAGYSSITFNAVARPNQEKEALEGVLKEELRIERYGITDSELDRVKTNVITMLESDLKEIDKTSNSSYIEDMKANFISKEPIIDFRVFYQAAMAVIPMITKEDVAAVASKYWKKDNRAVIVIGPSTGVQHLSETEAKAILEHADQLEVTPYEDEVSSTPLIEKELSGSPIVKTKYLKQFDAQEWTLGNGAKVIYRKADYEKDQVRLSAYSEGGTSIYSEDLLTASHVTDNLSSYGIGDMDAITLRKKLTGKLAQCKVGLDYLHESISGFAVPKDVETMLQLLYMRFEMPRFDADAHQIMNDRRKVQLAQLKDNPRKIMQDSLSLIYSCYNPRNIILDENNIDQITIDKVEKIYRDRFADASDFTFFIVGNIEADTLKPMVEKYIGSITSSNRKEKWINRHFRVPQGQVEKVIPLKLETPKTTVIATMTSKMGYNFKDDFKMSVLRSILENRYTKNIREKEGGTYGVGVSSDVSREPEGTYVLRCSFDCDPNRVNDLKPLLYAEIDSIIKNGVTDEELSKVVQNMIKDHASSKEHNAYWLHILQNYYEEGVDYNNPKNYEDLLNSFKPKDIQNFAKKFMKKADVLDIVFNPQEETK